MKKALEIEGFPLELTLNRRGKKQAPAVQFLWLLSPMEAKP